MTGLGILFVLIFEFLIRVVALAAVIGVLILVIGVVRKSRLMLVVGLVLSLGMGSVVLTYKLVVGLHRGVEQSKTPLQRARELMYLPEGAEIIEYKDGDWAGEATIQFRLPSTKSTSAWLDEVWQENLKLHHELQETTTKPPSAFERHALRGGAFMSLVFDPAKNIFVFEIHPEI